MANEHLIPEGLQPEDLVAFHELTRRGMPQDFWPRKFLKWVYSTEPSNFAVLKTNGIIGGIYSKIDERPALGRIVMVAVDAQHQRRGLGLRLLEYGIDRLQQQGASNVRLHTRPTNDPMIKLAEKVGFSTTGISAHYYRDGGDALDMELFLNGSHV